MSYFFKSNVVIKLYKPKKHEQIIYKCSYFLILNYILNKCNFRLLLQSTQRETNIMNSDKIMLQYRNIIICSCNLNGFLVAFFRNFKLLAHS